MSQSCLLYPTLPEHPSLFSLLSFPALLLSLRHPPPPYCLYCLLSLPPLPYYPSLPCCFLLYPKTLPLKAMWVYASALSSRFHCCCLVKWGYLRITQSFNQLQLILQQVLLFWSREATCEGIANFFQSENKIYAVIPARIAGHRTEMTESSAFVLFCIFFTVDCATYCRHCNSLQVWCLRFLLLLTNQQVLWIILKVPPCKIKSCL